MKNLLLAVSCLALAACCPRVAKVKLAAAMWQTPRLYGTCPNMPMFEMSGPDCGGQVEQETECRCSECMMWDPGVGGTPATFYRINRQTVSTGFTAIVGETHDQTVSYTDPVGGGIITITIPAARLWCFARDGTVPMEGMLYLYSVSACDEAHGCGEMSAPLRYVGAPYACYTGGAEVACYSGDPLTH